MTTLFLSYRRAETADFTGRLADSLASRFGRKHIFLDIDNIPPGVDFRAHIAQWVQKTDVMLVVIGETWLNVTEPGATMRRLDDPNDVIRVEIETALQLGITIIPLLAQNVTMPTADELPASLRSLAAATPVIVRRNPFFAEDVNRVVQEIMVRRYPDQPDTASAALFRYLDMPQTRWIIAGLVAVPIIAMLITWSVNELWYTRETMQFGPFDPILIVVISYIACILMGIGIVLLILRLPRETPYGQSVRSAIVALVVLVSVPLLVRLTQMVPYNIELITNQDQPFDFSITLPFYVITGDDPGNYPRSTIIGNLALQWLVLGIVALALVMLVWVIRRRRMLLAVLAGLAGSVLLSAPSWLQYLMLYQDRSYTSVASQIVKTQYDSIARPLTWTKLPDIITGYASWQDRLQLSVVYGSVVVLLIVSMIMLVRSLLWRRWWWSTGLFLAGITPLIAWKGFTVLTPATQGRYSASTGIIVLYSCLLIAALVVWPIVVLLSTIYLRSPARTVEAQS